MNYIKGLDLNGTHIAHIMEDFNVGTSGTLKCRIPVLMSNVPDGDLRELSTRISKSNLMNKNKSDIKMKTTISTCNYYNIYVPDWIRVQFPYDRSGYVKNNNYKIMITFVGGDIDHIGVLGRYE